MVYFFYKIETFIIGAKMNKKIIIYTGKGGVGKSSLASATALQAAKQNRKTILISTDRAHSLSDLFQTKESDKTRTINPYLDLLEINSEILIRENFPNFKEEISKIYPTSGINSKSIGNKFSIPGLENLVNLIRVKEIYDSDKYENIILDCPPTGSTISLLQLPELLSWYLEKFFPVSKKLVGVLNPISKRKYDMPLPSKKGMEDIEKFYYRLIDLEDLLKDKDTSCVRIVTLPEKIVVEETKRSYMYLKLYDYNVDRIFINRIYQGFDDNPFIEEMKIMQKTYIEELENTFSDLNIHKIKWYPEEINGVASIEKILDESLANVDLLDIENKDLKQDYIEYENGYILQIDSIACEKSAYKFNKIDSDLSISINNFKRIIPLPNILVNSFIEKIDFEEDKIKIYLNNKEKEE